MHTSILTFDASKKHSKPANIIFNSAALMEHADSANELRASTMSGSWFGWMCGREVVVVSLLERGCCWEQK